jgi:hypothetical protein
VKRVLDSETRVYVGSHYEYRAVGAGVTQYSYHYFGSKRVAMRRVVGEQNTLNYLHTDLLGSTGLATTSSGGMVQNSATYYYAYGAADRLSLYGAAAGRSEPVSHGGEVV